MNITFTVGDLVLLDLVSSNETVCIWQSEGQFTDSMLWQGPFWQCPQKYLDTQLDKIFGCIPESIMEADTINIRIKGKIPDYDKLSEFCNEMAEAQNNENYTFETGF